MLDVDACQIKCCGIELEDLGDGDKLFAISCRLVSIDTAKQLFAFNVKAILGKY
jgi:hypothetical protein